MTVKKIIAWLEKVRGIQGLASDNGGAEVGMESEAPLDEGGPENAIIVGLKYQLKGLELDIKAIREASDKVRKQIVVYQTRIENTPKREQEMVDLTRDYDNLRLSYENLMTRKIEAEQAAALERRQKGEQFRVIDPARIPETSFKPDVKKILAMTLFLAVGAGLGLALGREYLSKVFYDPEDVKKALNISVLACVPLLLTDAEKQRRRQKVLCLSIGAGAGYTAAIVLLLILLYRGGGAFSCLL